MEKKPDHILRIALIGPESTAKSTLTKALAKHYHTLYIEEYSRAYISNLDRAYVLDDIVVIAKEQFARELSSVSQANRFIFVDTELIVAKVWCEDVYKVCPEWISSHLQKHVYDFYLLTYPDLPWEEDGVRENGHRRDFFFKWYERELKNLNAEYAVITGHGEERLLNCIGALERFVGKL